MRHTHTPTRARIASALACVLAAGSLNACACHASRVNAEMSTTEIAETIAAHYQGATTWPERIEATKTLIDFGGFYTGLTWYGRDLILVDESARTIVAPIAEYRCNPMFPVQPDERLRITFGPHNDVSRVERFEADLSRSDPYLDFEAAGAALEAPVSSIHGDYAEPTRWDTPAPQHIVRMSRDRQRARPYPATDGSKRNRVHARVTVLGWPGGRAPTVRLDPPVDGARLHRLDPFEFRPQHADAVLVEPAFGYDRVPDTIHQFGFIIDAPVSDAYDVVVEWGTQGEAS